MKPISSFDRTEHIRATRCFLIATAVVTFLVLMAATRSGVVPVMQQALLGLAAAAFLPFVIILALASVLTSLGFGALILALVLALFTQGEGLGAAAELLSSSFQGAGAVTSGGDRFIPWYYGLISRIRHPLFWALPAGTGVGALILLLYTAIFVWPGEGRSAEILARTVMQLEAMRTRDGHYPDPTKDHRLPARILDPQAPAEAVLVDGFGRPVDYQLTGFWKLSRYHLRSVGYDGVTSPDDLVLEGASAADGLKLAFTAAKWTAIFYLIARDHVRHRDRMKILQQMRAK